MKIRKIMNALRLKILLFVGVLLLASNLGFSSPAYVQAGSCNTGGFSCTITLTVTSGNMLFVGVASGHTAPTLSVSSSPSNTFNIANPLHHYTNALSFSSATFIATGIANGSTVITCTTNDNTDYLVCGAAEFSDGATTDKLQVMDNPAGSTNPSLSGTTGATTAANEIAFGWFSVINQDPSSWTQSGSWLIASSQVDPAHNGSALVYQILGSTGTQQAAVNETGSRDCIGQIATFKSSGGGGSVAAIGKRRKLERLGVLQ